MKQYIDKTALVTEIEDWRDKIVKGIFDIPLHGREKADAVFEYEILGIVKDILDTFEVKEEDSINKKTEWSPSKKQMDSLQDMLKWNIGDFNYQKWMEVNSLYDDLKKI